MNCATRKTRGHQIGNDKAGGAQDDRHRGKQNAARRTTLQDYIYWGGG